MTLKIAVYGFGKMGQAIVSRWLRKKFDFQIDIFDPVINNDVEAMAANHGFGINPKLKKPVHDVVLLAIKPQTLGKIEKEIAKLIGKNTLVISIMAGKSIENLAEALNAKKIYRVMPNTPSQIGEGVIAYIGNNETTDEDEAILKSLLSPLGKVEKLLNEKLMDTVTAVSGSGPAYLYLLTEALAAAAYSEGLDQDMADRFARQTIIGSAALLKYSDLSPLELRKEVTSPGGTTEAALDVLTGGNAMGALMKRAIEAAVKRSKELGKPSS